MEKIKLRQGAAVRVSLVVKQEVPGGLEPFVDFFDGTEELVGFIWPGDDRARAATLPTGWEDAPNGWVYADIDAATSASLDVGWYKGVIQRVDTAWDLAYFELDIEPAPGSASAPSAYHTYKDLTDALPLVKGVADHLQDQGGFAEVGGEAKRWIDGIILGAVPIRGLGSYGLISTQRAWYWGGNAEMYRVVSETLGSDWLGAAGIAGDRIRQASINYALGTILRRAVGYKNGSGITDLGDSYMAKANALMSSGAVWFDAGGGQRYCIELGRTNTRRR